MARKTHASNLDSHINDIIARASRDIVSMIREISSEPARASGSGASSRTHAQPAAAPADTGGKRAKGKRGGRRGAGANDGALESLLDVIRAHPGLRSEQIQKHVNAAPKLVKAGLAKLRTLGRVKTSGIKRSTVYSAA